jgi:hypothetical protein
VPGRWHAAIAFVGVDIGDGVAGIEQENRGIDGAVRVPEEPFVG